MVIGAAFEAGNSLGSGFLEKVYKNFFVHELRKRGCEVKQQWPLAVRYDGVVVGDYVAELIVEDFVIVEVKAVINLDVVHLAQCLNYLKATGLTLASLVNFGNRKVGWTRIVHNF